MDGVSTGDDGLLRCSWGVSAPEYVRYHDEEWGFPVVDDVRLFEKLSLEGFQSGLSWLTILRKRDDFRRVFHGFDIEQVAQMGETDVERLLGDASIIRHRGKIEATINNATKTLDLIEETGSLSAYVWEYGTDRSDPGRSTSPESISLARNLKNRGFRFVGPTTAYAFMQAMGLVNDHFRDCWVWERAESERRSFNQN